MSVALVVVGGDELVVSQAKAPAATTAMVASVENCILESMFG